MDCKFKDFAVELLRLSFSKVLSVPALGKWGRKHMGSDGCNRILTGFYLSSTVEVRLVPLKTHDFTGFRPILSGF